MVYQSCDIGKYGRKKKISLSFRNFPIHARTIYLRQTDRVSSSTNPASMTIFKTTVRGNSFNGVADKCYREDRDKWFASTDSLDGIVVPPKYPDGIDDSSIKIRTYMEEMFIGREYYNVFRGMNFRAKQVLAFPLRKPDDSIWGVVVVDTDDSFDKSLDDLLKEHIGDYMVMFRSMCKSLK